MAAPRIVPTLQEWKSLSQSEREDFIRSWNANSDDGEPLLSQIVEEFRMTFGGIPGIEIRGWANYHGSHVIDAYHPFVFDRRALPGAYLSIPIHTVISDMPLPPEFEVAAGSGEYVWAPPRYKRFVDRCSTEIRRRLGKSNMSREEMLDALAGMDFSKWVAICQKWADEGRIARFDDVT